MGKRNGYIDLLRFIASIVIVLFHFGLKGSIPFLSGSLFVELFFVLSSFFALRYIYKIDISENNRVPPNGVSCEKIILRYIKKQYVKMLPYIIISVLLYYLCKQCGNWQGIKACLKMISYMPLEILLLQRTGATTIYANVLWYLSALFICLPIVMWLAVKYKEVFKHYLVWWGAFLAQGYLLIKNGTLRTTVDLDGLIRTFGALLMGGCAYYLVEKLKACRLTAFGRRSLFALELGTMGLVLYLMQIGSIAKSRYDEVIFLLMSFSLVISLSGQTPTANVKGALFGYLAKLSLAIYCCHAPTFRLVKIFFGNGKTFYTNDVRILLGLVVTLVVSAAAVAFADHAFPKAIKGLKRAFILDEKGREKSA